MNGFELILGNERWSVDLVPGLAGSRPDGHPVADPGVRFRNLATTEIRILRSAGIGCYLSARTIPGDLLRNLFGWARRESHRFD